MDVPTLALQRLQRKYDRQFHAHFSNFISELIYDHIHTHFRVITKDLLLLYEEQEYLSGYVREGEQWPTITQSAEEFSARVAGGELPMALLTKTKSIFQQRRKRFKKLLEERSSSRETSRQQRSEQSETVVLLGQSLENFNFSNIESSKASSPYGLSFCNVYSVNSFSNATANEEKEESSIQHSLLRQMVQSKVKHLIMECNSKASQRTEVAAKGVKASEYESGQSSTSQAIDSLSSIQSQIESVVRAQLKKYRIGTLLDRASANSQRSHMTVRDKAQEFLRNIRRDFIA